jgi:hypothetical protein
MRPGILLILFFASSVAFGIPCDCDVMVYAPLTGTHALSPNRIKTYELEEFSAYSQKNMLECRNLCEKEFNRDMGHNRLGALLLTYSERLIENGVLGRNCTGLTTLKFPVRVKAILGKQGLGNVVDTIHIVNHEETCF